MDTKFIEITAVATEDGVIYCGECAHKLLIELCGDSIY